MSEKKTTKTTTYRKNGSEVILTVERPVLSQEEYEKRLDELKNATAEFLKANYRAEARQAV